MGLDMVLGGNKFFSYPEGRELEEGYPVERHTLELAYWRKHPDLHGYIVDAFAEGNDDCQEIQLIEEDLKQLIKAVKDDLLPTTRGFFFGESDWAGEQDTVQKLEKALSWLLTDVNGIWKTVFYRASW